MRYTILIRGEAGFNGLIRKKSLLSIHYTKCIKLGCGGACRAVCGITLGFRSEMKACKLKHVFSSFCAKEFTTWIFLMKKVQFDFTANLPNPRIPVLYLNCCHALCCFVGDEFLNIRQKIHILHRLSHVKMVIALKSHSTRHRFLAKLLARSNCALLHS